MLHGRGRCIIPLIEVAKGENRENARETGFIETRAEKFPDLIKNMNPEILGLQ